MSTTLLFSMECDLRHVHAGHAAREVRVAAHRHRQQQRDLHRTEHLPQQAPPSQQAANDIKQNSNTRGPRVDALGRVNANTRAADLHAVGRLPAQHPGPGSRHEADKEDARHCDLSETTGSW